MRTLQDATYNKHLEKRIVGLDKDMNPENFSQIDIPVNTLIFDINSLSFDWVRGSINGVDVAKIQALVSFVQYFSQEYKEYVLPFSKAAVNNTSGKIITDAFDNELAYTLASTKTNNFAVELQIPSGWDGRNSFVKMDWDNGQKQIVDGPLRSVQSVANYSSACTVGWTVYKSESMIRLNYTYPARSEIANKFVFMTRFKDVSIKLWRSANASRR